MQTVSDAMEYIRTCLTFGRNPPVYFTQRLRCISTSPTRCDSFDKLHKVHLDREGDSDRIPYSDLFKHQVPKAIADLPQIGPFDIRFRHRLSLVPSVRKGARGRTDEGVQILDHTQNVGLGNGVDLGEERLGGVQFRCPLSKQFLLMKNASVIGTYSPSNLTNLCLDLLLKFSDAFMYAVYFLLLCC